jgi:hypothetical protein
MVNTKIGLSYFAVDTDIFQDRKIKQLKRTFGCQGIAILFYLLAEVYRDKGCGLEWDENTALDVADYLGVKETLVSEVVKYCGVVGLFDATLLSGGIITSAAIQRRYIEMSKRAKRTSILIPENWRIVEETTDDDTNTSVNIPETFPKHSRNIPEDFLPKEKKSKVKESKEKESSVCEEAHTHTHTQEENQMTISFKNYLHWCERCAQSLLMFKEPLTCEQYAWLLKRYAIPKIQKCAEEMHNKGAYEKNISAFLTFKSWISRIA